MRITTASPVRTIEGTYKSSDVVFFTRNGRQYARGRSKPANPKTADQALIRAYMSVATKHWHTLSDVQRQAWQAYAEAYLGTDTDGEPVDAFGINAYLKANSIRQMLGLALTSDAPTIEPPAPVTSITQLDAQNPDNLGLTVVHGLTVVTGLQLLVRMTPAMRTVACKPRPGDLRFAHGVTPASAVALPASGGQVTVGPTRFSVEDGQRYGVEVRIVRTADGIASTATYGDFRKSV